MNPDILRKCWFLAGPTASGKSATALELARRIDGEILSMDSMAIYRGMDIGTAKATKNEQREVPHHLIDIVDPQQAFSVSDYVVAAETVATDVLSGGRIPLFVGGTGLYLRSLLRGVFEGPEADWEFRRDLERKCKELGNDWLHSELRKFDEQTAARLHPNDIRRVIRAIEVHHVTGQPLSTMQQQTPPNENDMPPLVCWLDPPREWLHERINRRVDEMMRAGLLEETQRLLSQTPPPGRTARQALGYREIIAHIEDSVPLEVAVEQIKTGTRQFAKRQYTWFRNLEECISVPLKQNSNAVDLADVLVAMGESRS